jgi:hypothetical protein
MRDLTQVSRSFASYVQDNAVKIGSFKTQDDFIAFINDAQDNAVQISDNKVYEISQRITRSRNLFSMQKVLFDSLLAGAGLSVI